eukprot:TRINITY_DN33241_c0_g1_i1.p2 TRINITY_DN33241_c0_g1~~TRINITY_DN33241_c0_g1_i1.p2  ORF type:complete len:168 (+),score=44.32 TRINITY_DN33241_c0_g1_i1:82-585(+)
MAARLSARRRPLGRAAALVFVVGAAYCLGGCLPTAWIVPMSMSAGHAVQSAATVVDAWAPASTIALALEDFSDAPTEGVSPIQIGAVVVILGAFYGLASTVSGANKQAAEESLQFAINTFKETKDFGMLNAAIAKAKENGIDIADVEVDDDVAEMIAQGPEVAAKKK